MKYLELVTYEENSFENINDLISRYNILCKINGDLIRGADNSENEIEQLKISTAKYLKEKQTEILVLNSNLIQSKQMLERTLHDKVSKEHEMFESDRSATEKVEI
jgi:superfamily II DNA or RNA helicase